MPMISLRQGIDRVKSGEKRTDIRPTQRAKVGDRIYFYSRLRTKAHGKLQEGICTNSRLVIMGKDENGPFFHIERELSGEALYTDNIYGTLEFYAIVKSEGYDTPWEMIDGIYNIFHKRYKLKSPDIWKLPSMYLIEWDVVPKSDWTQGKI